MINFWYWLFASSRPQLETQTSELRRRLAALRSEIAAVKQIAKAEQSYKELEAMWLEK